MGHIDGDHPIVNCRSQTHYLVISKMSPGDCKDKAKSRGAL